MTHLGNMLYLYRASQRVEQQELAEIIGITPAKLSRIQRGIGGLDAEELLTIRRWLIGEVPMPAPRQMQVALAATAEVVP